MNWGTNAFESTCSCVLVSHLIPSLADQQSRDLSNHEGKFTPQINSYSYRGQEKKRWCLLKRKCMWTSHLLICYVSDTEEYSNRRSREFSNSEYIYPTNCREVGLAGRFLWWEELLANFPAPDQDWSATVITLNSSQWLQKASGVHGKNCTFCVCLVASNGAPLSQKLILLAIIWKMMLTYLLNKELFFQIYNCSHNYVSLLHFVAA